MMQDYPFRVLFEAGVEKTTVAHRSFHYIVAIEKAPLRVSGEHGKLREEVVAAQNIHT